MAIETLEFGRTGHLSSRVIFGAAALGGMSQERADATIDLIRAAGVNHFDTARSYGESELRLAPWLAKHRSEVFLATKTGERNGSDARRQLEESLGRLGVDQVDLIQLHNLVEPDDFDTAHGSGGVVEAMVTARNEGLVRYIGVTGHGTRIPRMLMQSLQRFDFDSVLYPYNFSLMQDSAFRADVDALRAMTNERGVANQTIKAVARRRWPRAEIRKFSWYQPLTDPVAITASVRYVLTNPDLFLNTTSDARLLPAIIEAAQGTATAPSHQEMVDLTQNHDVTALFDGADLERI